MPVSGDRPTAAQTIELRQLYNTTKFTQEDGTPRIGTPTFDGWRAQMTRQGQWTFGAVNVTINYLQDRQRGQQMQREARRAEAERLRTPGWEVGHHLIDGEVFHVHPLRGPRGLRYPEAREVHSLDLNRLTETGRARWRFRARAYEQGRQATYAHRLPRFTTQTLMTGEAIRQFGATHGFCGICGRQLTVTESVARGVGPVCWRRVREYEARQYRERAEMAAARLTCFSTLSTRTAR